VVEGDRPPVVSTRALPKLLASLRTRGHTVLVDLGPVVGGNLTFFGDQLGCKIFVEDLFHDLDRHVRGGSADALPAFLASRLPQPDGSIDAVLAWDVFDYLERPAAEALAGEPVRVLKPTGVLFAIFGTDKVEVGQPFYTRRLVVDETALIHKEYPAALGKQPPWLNRDLMRMLEPLTVAEQFLLKTHTREVLFRKPAA